MRVPAVNQGLEQAIESYSRSAFQIWTLPLSAWRAFRGETTLQSTQFSVTNAPPLGGRYALALTQPLAPGLPYANQSEAVPPSAVRIEPNSLGPGESTFRLLIEGHAFHHLPGATYWGYVTVTDVAGGNVIEQRRVWMVVS